MAEKYPSRVFDPDSNWTPELKERLTPLQNERRWDEHNAIWHKVLADWALTLPKDAIIPVHSIEMARDMQKATGGKIYRRQLQPDELARRILSIYDDDPRRAELAIINWGGNMNNPDYLALPEI